MLAEALRDWLPLVINAVEPWMSSVDIDSGSRWTVEVANTLELSRVGIFCLTAENLKSTWLHFEAGAIAKNASKSYVCTLLLELSPDQVEWPLAQFQAKESNKRGIFELVRSINSADGVAILSETHLQRALEMWWPVLDEAIAGIPAAEITEHPEKPRSSDSVLLEILGLLRDQERKLNRQAPKTAELPTASRYRIAVALREANVNRAIEEIRTLAGVIGVADVNIERLPDDSLLVSKNDKGGQRHVFEIAYRNLSDLTHLRNRFAALFEAWRNLEANDQEV